MATIVLVDDHQMMLEGLSSMLNDQPDLNVVGEAKNGEEAINLIQQLRPDVAIVDILMPRINGIEVAHQVAKVCPTCKTIILSMYSADEYVREVFQTGAKAYVLKKDSFEDLITAIHEVLAGRVFISPRLTQHVISSYYQNNTNVDNHYSALTKRELQILPLVANGETSVEIGEKLFISKRTVEFHRSNIMQKLNLRSQNELIRYCFEMGIIAT